MPPDPDQNARAMRDLMDESLSAERLRVDSELATRSEALQEDSDDIVKLARARAQQVLRAARARADVALANEGAEAREQVAQERAQEDRARAREQAASDATLSAERELRRQALAELLEHERRATDHALFDERALADGVLQRRDDLFAMVNHDFMNLASSVAMNAATIVAEADAEGACGRRIIARADAIRSATLQMVQLGSSLLDVASINAGVLPLDRRAADAGPVVREVVRLFEPVLAKKGLSLDVHIADGTVGAVFDAARLSQILINLLNNAVKFTPPPGTVSVRVTELGSEVEFAVSDTGCGIPANELSAVFGRFSRAHGARAAGHGLGLYICRHLVAAHQGELTVESEVGRGSTFKFRIPAAEADLAHGDMAKDGE